MQEMTPLIYTPTVGEACQRWSELYTQPEGMYLSFEDRGRLREVIQNWPRGQVDITVVTDGSRILGLGDLGINGMGIPVGKLSLYTACAGIHPRKTLPLCLDLGTSNQGLHTDPNYLGSRRGKVTPEEEKEFLDEMMVALTERWPGSVIWPGFRLHIMLTPPQDRHPVRGFQEPLPLARKIPPRVLHVQR